VLSTSHTAVAFGINGRSIVYSPGQGRVSGAPSGF
jgi:hypothetical protein